MGGAWVRELGSLRLDTHLTLLHPPLGIQAPLSDLERLWLETSAYYAVFNETVMEDTLWDQMAQELWDRRLEEHPFSPHGLSPYFCHSVGLPWPISRFEGGDETNPLKTAMGVNWEEGLPAIVVEGIQKDSPERIARWKARIKALEREYRLDPTRSGPHARKPLNRPPRAS